MILITDYEAYWETIKERLPGIKTLDFINNDKDMGKSIQDLKKEQMPILFVAVPSGDGFGDVDNDQEKNIGLLFFMSKYDAQGKTKAYDIQKELQPIFEALKDLMKNDSMNDCSIMANLEIDSMHTDPEYKLYSDFSGWSLSFVF